MSINFMNDDALRRNIAGQSPTQLLKHLSFWSRHKAMFLIIGACVTASWILAPLMYNIGGDWIYFDIFVQLFIVYGAVITAKSLAHIEVETAIACEVETRGDGYLGDIKSGQRIMVDLDKLEETMLPNNPSSPQPAMIRMFQHICKEAKDRKFESSINITQPYKDEMFEDIFKLQNLQKLALWLGILGSFIGLLNAITGIDLAVDNVLASLPNILKQMFKGLSVSFSASLIGLEVAVVLGLFLLMLRKRQESYVRRMESAAITMLSLARHAVNRDDFLATFEQVSLTIKVVGERCQEVTKSVADQTKRIEAGIGALSASETHFKDFLDDVAKSQNDFITQMKSLYDKKAMVKLGEELRQSIIEAGQKMANTLDTNASGISGELNKFNETVSTLTASLENFSREATISLGNALRQSIIESGQQMTKTINESTSGITDGLKVFHNTVSSLSATLEKYSRESAVSTDKIHTDLKNSLLQTSNELRKYVELANLTLARGNNASIAAKSEMEILSSNIKSLTVAVKDLKQITPRAKQGFIESMKNLFGG